MYNALDIAKYIITKCNKDGFPISNLQLQKILYNLQKFFLQNAYSIGEKKEGKLFKDDIEAWQWGPVIPNVYFTFCIYGAMTITGTYDVQINNNIKKIIDPIIERKRRMNPWLLVDETHKKNGAWDRIYKDGAGNHCIIPCELIKELG
jgi:uncharacterized phage-associated protein